MSEHDGTHQLSWKNATGIVNFLLLTAVNDFDCEHVVFEDTVDLHSFWWTTFKHSEGNCFEVTKNLYDRVSLRMLSLLEKDDFKWKFQTWDSFQLSLPNIDYTKASSVCDPHALISSKYIEPFVRVLASENELPHVFRENTMEMKNLSNFNLFANIFNFYPEKNCSQQISGRERAANLTTC